jgi:hypothetical protein
MANTQPKDKTINEDLSELQVITNELQGLIDQGNKLHIQMQSIVDKANTKKVLENIVNHKE